MIYRIAETTSTNDDAKRPEYRHGDIVWAERQTAGRGQRGHSWTSPEGENLTFTLVLEPVFLPVGEQFLLSEAVTLALTDTFAAFGIDARIKWTNDIYPPAFRKASLRGDLPDKFQHTSVVYKHPVLPYYAVAMLSIKKQPLPPMSVPKYSLPGITYIPTDKPIQDVPSTFLFPATIFVPSALCLLRP